MSKPKKPRFSTFWKATNEKRTSNFFSLGENALKVGFDNEISVELNKKVLNLAYYFDENRFPGVVE